MASNNFVPKNNFRGKKIRVGFRPDVAVAMRGEGDATSGQGNRYQKSPVQRVRGELSEALDNKFFEKYNMTDILKREIIAEAVRIDTITTMNIPTLAAVMVYLRIFPSPSPEDFTDETLDPFLDYLMQDFITPQQKKDQGNQEEQEVRYKYKQTILRYILKILALREGNQPIQEPLGEIPVISKNKTGVKVELEEDEDFE